MAQGKKEEAEEVKKQVTANAERLAELEAKESELEEKIKNSFKREKLANNTLEKSNSYVFNNNKSSEKSLSYNVSVKFNTVFSLINHR